ncbi:MAG: tryptophan 7-halogenase [Alphaproteobacteria bacterium]|nr:MAG: tryptophan 7-halogenase [Alphaproteobacteria bacterium]
MFSMSKAVRSVVIVGGGSAGWITAAVIAAHHRAHLPGALHVTLIESPNVPTVGVGEGTWPTMRSTLIKLGISETEFFRQCDASFKQGAKFARWVDGGDDDYYYHPLMLPQGFPKIDLAPYWHRFTEGEKKPPSFSQAVCFQEAVCERGLAPKMITTAEFGHVANYAYHLDTGKFAPFLQRHATEKLGVRHILDDVVEVVAAENGDIACLKTKNSGDLAGDLFVDCTGFASLLLGKHYGVPFIDCSDVLFIDTALAVHVPYAREDDPVIPYTVSTGQSAGWIWDIGLPTRRGVGYVYSSRYSSEDEAVRALRAYIGPRAEKLSIRKIPIRSGHRQIFWKQNCVAVGLSAGFLEPLEASALVLIELSADMLAKQLPACREVMDIAAKRFNSVFNYRWDRIIDFLKLHYMLSRREDSRFWIDNRDPASIPESLREQLELWRYQSPGDHDFTSNNEVFPAASYQYVLYGMGFRTDFRYRRDMLADEAKAKQQFAQNAQMKRKAVESLPTNRALIDKIHRHGLQPI